MTGAIDALAKGMGESFLQSAGKKSVLIQVTLRTVLPTSVPACKIPEGGSNSELDRIFI